MRNFDHIIIKNVRCFDRSSVTPLAPLTFLVGDNSAGKSTFLALCRIAWDLAYSRGSRRINFNEEPFLLGGFDQIASYRGGRAGRATHFEIGMRRPLREKETDLFSSSGEMDVEYVTKFERSGSHPLIVEERLSALDLTLTVRRTQNSNPIQVELVYQGETYTVPVDTTDAPFHLLERDVPMDIGLLSYLISRKRASSSKRRADDPSSEPPYEALNLLELLFRSQRRPPSARPIACAPVRTKPERVYSPVSDSPVPEGGHVPMVLARLFFEDKPQWEQLKNSLEKFGQSAGLFKSIEVKSLGRHEGDPFQLRFKIDGPATNLLDIGYGVSQVLPILVDALLARSGQTYLLQQPEVHLHPRGQAELGTFLGQLTAKQKRRFVVETHSDYLVDRVRMDIRDGKGLSPKDVVILFFDRSGGDLKVHEIGIDERGDLIGAPPSFRLFFLQEEKRFLLGS